MNNNKEELGIYWCPDNAISTDFIDRRAVKLAEAGKHVDTVYLSADVYAEYLKQYLYKQVYSVDLVSTCLQQNRILSVWTSVGELLVIPVHSFTNFCYVGTRDNFEFVLDNYLTKMFDEIVLENK